MGFMYLLSRNGKLQHTYSKKLRDKMVADNWKFEAFITGFNVGITYRGN